MIKNFTILGEIKDGKVALNRNYLSAMLTKLGDGKVSVEFSKKISKRSLSQNNLYWLWLGVIGETLGYTANEIHEVFKRLFLKPRELKYRGRIIKMPSTTTELSIGEMAEYLNAIEREAGQLGILLPDPEKYLYGDKENI